jgi:predicted NBD/HSP70 family sugar kinase
MIDSSPLSPLRKPGARADDVRRHNLALVVQQIALRGTVSRAELARLTHLTKGTVSAHVQELLRLGLLTELGVQAEGRVGRPHNALALNGERHCGIGLEINVDYLAVSVADLLNRVRFHRVEAVDNRDVPHGRVFDRAARLIRTALDAAAADGLSPAGVAVAVPGTIDQEHGMLLVAPNLAWTDVHVAEALEERLAPLDIPVLVDNEANLAALGELWLGIGGECGDYVHVSGEIGVGGGVVVDGALFRGARGFAGEIGHVVVDPDGDECQCGGRGCLERVAGQEALFRAAGLPSTSTTRLGQEGNAMEELVRRLEAGDEQAHAAVRRASDALGIALAGVVNVIDPDTIVLGGTYASLAPWLIDRMREKLGTQVLGARSRTIDVLCSALGPDAAVRGASAWIVQSVLAAPDSVS